MSVGLSHVGPWLFSFYSMQKVSGQQILEVCFEWILSFALRLVVHIHAYGKSDLKVQKAWIPECLPSFYFIIIFFSREIFFQKGIYFLFIVVNHIFIF